MPKAFRFIKQPDCGVPELENVSANISRQNPKLLKPIFAFTPQKWQESQRNWLLFQTIIRML